MNPKSAPRRELKLGSFDELHAELDRIEAAHNAGTLRHTGNWTPAEILDHLAIVKEFTLDGFPFKVNPILRYGAQLFIKPKVIRGEPLPAGIKLSGPATAMLPRKGVGFRDAIQRLRTVLGRLDYGEQFNKPSPIFGKFTHQQWSTLHLGHSKLHLSFLTYDNLPQQPKI